MQIDEQLLHHIGYKKKL